MRSPLLVALALGALVVPASAADPDAGKQAFRKCMACHMVGEDAKNRVGPVLNGVVGRQLGSLEGYNYSKGMSDAGAAGAVWDNKTLDQFLADPRAFVPGTKMAFAGVKDETDRANIVAYLSSLPGD